MVAAKIYYRQLMKGDYRNFLEGKAGNDSLPQGYREQLITAYKQFAVQQEKAHKGILKVEALRAVADSSQLSPDNGTPLMQVFLQICYGDSTQEEIVVPMVSYKGDWMMK